MERIKGLTGLTVALGRPRWRVVAGVGIAGALGLANDARLSADPFDMVQALNLAAGLATTALLVGITATAEGTRRKEAWEAAVMYGFGAIFLCLPAGALGILATRLIGGAYPTSRAELAGAAFGALLQVVGLTVYAMIRGVRQEPVEGSQVPEPQGASSRWD